MRDSTRCVFVGLDARKGSMAVAVLRPGRMFPIAAPPEHISRHPRKLAASWRCPESVRVCYEAGPTAKYWS